MWLVAYFLLTKIKKRLRTANNENAIDTVIYFISNLLGLTHSSTEPRRKETLHRKTTMPTPPRSNSLLEPLLPSSSDNEDHDENNVEEETIALQPTDEQNVNGECEDNDVEQSHEQEFTIRSEIVEMVSLGFPLAVSFFCRMGMASTDSAFVGHLHDHSYSAEIYLAASVLSDMCVNVFVTPALAFNQVLNGLVGQAMGSNNPKMAGVWLQQSMFWLALAMLPFLAAFFFGKCC